MDLRSLRCFVAVAEELHFGRAARRLHLSQPPLSRTIRQLEAHLGCRLFDRSPRGVELTEAGRLLYHEAVALLAQAQRLTDRMASMAGEQPLVFGSLGDSAGTAGPELVEAYRRCHPRLRITIREADLTDPTAGLRAGLVDVALTRLPFDTAGITTRVLRVDPLVAVLPASDPLAIRPHLSVEQLQDRPWFRLPDGTDPVWQAYWAAPPGAPAGPVVRTVGECIHAVLWDQAVGIMPADGRIPDGVAAVPLHGRPPSRLVVAWATDNRSPLVTDFARLAIENVRPATASVHRDRNHTELLGNR